MSNSEEIPHPPQAPEIERHIRLSRLQWIGVPLLILIPIAALLGLFDESRRTAAGQGEGLELQVEFPTRTRYGWPTHLDVEVRNRSFTALDAVLVSFDPDYLAAFRINGWIPQPVRANTVEVFDLQPGETRWVQLRLEGERYGRYRGLIKATAGGAEVSAHISTFLFP